MVVAREQGFSLFEVVVTICLIVILYLVALNRMDSLPAAAERGAFFGSLSHVKAGVQLHMVNLVTAGRMDELKELEGSNPMRFLLETPGNYRGEVDEVTPRLRRASWYFEHSTQDLVYVVGNSSIDNVYVDYGVTVVRPGQLRFRVNNVYEDGRWQALMLQAQQPFLWDAQVDMEQVSFSNMNIQE